MTLMGPGLSNSANNVWFVNEKRSPLAEWIPRSEMSIVETKAQLGGMSAIRANTA